MRFHIGRMIFRGAVAGAVIVTLAAGARAQTPESDDATKTQELEVAEPAAEQIQPAPVGAPTTRQPYWSSVGGFEVDSHETGYGFFGPQYIHPVQDRVAFIGTANANYLFYEFEGPQGRTDVHSPGVSVLGGLMFGDRNWFSAQAGPTFRTRRERLFASDGGMLLSDSDVRVGFNLLTQLWVDPTSHNNVYAMYNYETVDAYHWGRISFKEQLANHSWQGTWTPYLGAEYVAQGNDDIQSQQFGPFIEVLHVPSSISVMLRGGYKRTHQFGPDRAGPWVAVGFFHRFR